jgi:hypothetical protein
MVPVALSTSAWGRGALFEDIGAINPARPARFAIGAPVDIGDDAFEAHRKVTAFIDSRLAGWSGRDAPLPASHGGGRRPTTMSPLMEARFPYNPTHE